MFSPEIKRGIILDHYQKPRNHGLVDNENYKKIRKTSESCIDDITVQANIVNNVIKDIKYDGEACTISTSSTSIISELILNKSIEEANIIIHEYEKMLKGEAFNEDMLEEANAFNELYRQANRIKCGLIGVAAIKELINKGDKDE